MAFRSERTVLYMFEDMFKAELKAGKPIKTFMIAGVLEKEYGGERGAENTRRYLDSSLAEAAQSLKGKSFKEFDEFELCGVHARWEMFEASSPLYADGHYYVMERLALLPVYIQLESERDQTAVINVRASRLIALLNDELAFDGSAVKTGGPKRRYGFEHGGQWRNERTATAPFTRVSLRLKAGLNRLILLTGKIDRGTGITFSLSLDSAEFPLWATIPVSADEKLRRDIAISKLTTHMVDDCYRTGETPQLQIGNLPVANCDVVVSVNNWQGKWSDHFKGLRRADDAGADVRDWSNFIADKPIIDLPAELPPDKYVVSVKWQTKSGAAVVEAKYSFAVIETLAPMPGYDRFEERRNLALERLAAQRNPLALYRLGRYDEIDEARIDALCSRIDIWADCADFDLMPLLWLAWEDRDARKLSPAVHERIRKAALGFRYWVDEPGVSSMFYCSENHRIGFHVCEYLAGLLYPLDVFTNVNQNGMYHSLKGRMHLMEWLNQRCRGGFDEPHSDSYLPVTMSALLVLREVFPIEEYALINMNNILLDFLVFILATGDFNGIMATPRGRSYNEPLRSSLVSGTNNLFWILFGNSPANANRFNQELAFSPYIPPRGICELAYDETPVDITFKEGLMHFDKRNADFRLRRTPDYMLGGVRDHNVGFCDMHFISAYIALKNDIGIFFSAPNTVAEGGGLRPDYWAGQAFMPRVLMARRTLAVIWHGVKDDSIWMTHCHFNARRFDETAQRDGWTFGRSGDGYVAIYSDAPHYMGQTGKYAGRELICDGTETVWLAECGSRAEDGSFEEFIAKITSARKSFEGDTVVFDSPGSGLMEFGRDAGFKVDGADVPVPEYLVDSPYLKSRFGSGRFEYTCPGFELTEWSYPFCE